jgi:hypothetical protein
LQGVDESRGISKSKLHVAHGAPAKILNILDEVHRKKCPSYLHFMVLACAWQLSHYCGEKIHDRNLKVAHAENAHRH